MIFDVKLYGGAVGDGVHDDTAAIQKTINDAAVMLMAGQSPGPVYFPPSSGPYFVDTLTFPNFYPSSKGYLYHLFDNGLLANKINIGAWNAFQGRASAMLMGDYTSFGPKAEWCRWQKPADSGPFVELDGTSFVSFDGISMIQQSGSLPTVAMHDHTTRGCVFVGFNNCQIAGSEQPFVMTASASNVLVGYGLQITKSTIQSLGNGPALSIYNYGDVVVRDGYLKSVSISNGGVSLMADYKFERLLSESLNNQPWLTTGWAFNLTLDTIEIADATGSCPLVKNIGSSTTITIRNCGYNDGNSLVDPTSTPKGLQGIIESMGARGTYKLAKQCFQYGEFRSPQGPAIFYADPDIAAAYGSGMLVNPADGGQL